MPDYELRADNWRTWPAELFDREDPAPDEQFYLEPRKVVHVDLYALQAVADLYRELAPPDSAVLDLMSAWRSHLPTEVKYRRVVGLGMNREVARVLNPGAPFIVTFSNRCFPTKAIRLWLHTDDQSHMQIVALYFLATGQFDQVTYQDRSPGPQFDPLYAVWGRKRAA